MFANPDITIERHHYHVCKSRHHYREASLTSIDFVLEKARLVAPSIRCSLVGVEGIQCSSRVVSCILKMFGSHLAVWAAMAWIRCDLGTCWADQLRAFHSTAGIDGSRLCGTLKCRLHHNVARQEEQSSKC